jgi:hypothetical protein
MWSPWVKEKGTTQVMCIAKLKDDPKKLRNGMMEGEKMESHQKGFLKSKCFSPLKILTSTLFEETLVDFLSLPLVFFFLSLGGF